MEAYEKAWFIRVDETVNVTYLLLSDSGQEEAALLAGNYGQELIVYDPKEQTVILSLEYFPHKSVEIGDTFDIQSIKSGSSHYAAKPLEINLSQLSTESKEYMKVTENIRGGGDEKYRKRLASCLR